MSTPESHEFVMPLLSAYELNLLEDDDRDEVETHAAIADFLFFDDNE